MKKYTREEMKDIMQVRGYSHNTIKIYIDHLKNFAIYFNKPPHTVTPEHIHKYQVFLVQEKQVSWSFFNQAVCALRFFLTMLSAMTGLSSTSHSKRNTNYSLSFFQEQKQLPSFQ